MKKYLAITLLTGALLGAGCGDSRQDFVITNNNQNQAVAPVCADDAYTTNQNTPLVVNAANGVLANDVPSGATLTFNANTTGNGTVAINQDGSFTYTPATDFNGTDTFQYTLTNPAGSRTCTVTITVTAVNGFFVDATNGSDGTGSFTNGRPFQTIQAALTAAPPGSTVVVRPGNYTGPIALENGDRLVGSGSTLVNAQGTTRPTLTGPVDLADGNTLDFLRIANAPNDAINGDGQNGGTVTNCEIDTTSANLGSGIQATARGNWVISNNTITNVLGAGIDFRTEGSDSAVVRINDNIITNNDFNAIGFITSASSNLRAQITGNTMTGNQTGFTFEIIAGQTSVSCYDIENNTNDDTYVITSDDATATLQVEEYNSLISINNNSGTSTVGLGGLPPTQVPDGFCGF